jgi:two-component system NarL family sensor kinase
MTTMTAAITRAAVTTAGLLVVATAVLVAAYRLDPVGVGLAVLAIVSLSVPLVGAAAARAQRRNAVGWLLLVTGVSIPLAVAAYLYAHAADTGADLPGAPWAGWLDAWPWTPALTLVPVLGLLLFPTGRPASRGWLVLVWTGIAVLAAQLLNALLAPHLLDFPDRANPTGLGGAAGSAADALGATIVFVPILATAGAWSLHQRRRRAARPANGNGNGDGAARTEPALAAALRLAVPAGWLIAASWWGCGVVIAATGNSDDALAPELLGIVALAAAAWVAIYRYRLFDARQVLSRTLVYATLTACVLAVYFAVAAVVGAVVRGTVSQPVAVIAAVAVALPIQDVLRRWVTRLVYGDRDDPYAALVRLGRRLEDAAEPDDVLPAVARTIRRALRLDFVGIEVGEMTARAGIDHGEGDRFPLVFAGETIGSLTVSRPEGRAPGPGEGRLLDGIIRQVAAAGHAVALTMDIRRSREQLVTATEEERRRLRRDLHDGLGPGLAGVVLGLHRAQRQIPSDPDAAVAQLDTLSQQTQEAIAEVRRLVDGLRPGALDELGLVAALTQRAESFGDIAVTGPDPVPELPAAVEVAVYRIAVEAMTNISRHARAGHATVRISVGGDLELEITDDGEGLPDAFRAGVGISSMRERAAELGGRCTVEPASPRGTQVRATIPLEIR